MSSPAGPRDPVESSERALLAGWFSFPDGSATAGDLSAARLARSWFERAGIPADIAIAPPFTGDVRYDAVDPADYSHAAFICGPFAGAQASDFLERFNHCRLIGLNLTLAYSSEVWEPFDLVVARDRGSERRADMVFAAPSSQVPIVGLVFVEPYEGADTTGPANALSRLLTDREAASFSIDTRLDRNLTGFRTSNEVESAIARMDVVLTTRLHGLVLALKHGVPVVAIDPDPRIRKLLRQGEAVGWPHVYEPGVDDEELAAAFGYCLTPRARQHAAEVGQRGLRQVNSWGATVVATLTDPAQLEAVHQQRLLNRLPRQSTTPPDVGRLAALPAPLRKMLRALLALLRRADLRRRSRVKGGQPPRSR